VGATLAYALSGRSPFERDTTAATISAVLHAEIPPVRTRGPLGPVLSGLLQRAPEDRLTGPQAAALLATAGGLEQATPEAPVRRSRRWWPAAALVLGIALGAAGGMALAGAGAPDVRTFTYGEGGDVPLFAVRTESCVTGQLAAGRAFPASARVGCSAPHDLEVFRAFDPFGAKRALPYPGRDELGAYAAAACTLVFDSALIAAPDRDRLEVVALVPSRAAFETWSGAGDRFDFADREVICVLRAADGGQLTGSRIANDPG
jgi:hypothetical protein